MIRGSRVWLSRALVLSATLYPSFAVQYISDTTCNFTFSGGDLPKFQLPEAGQNNPGDQVLNANNSIIHVQNASEPVFGCNGESASYYVGNNTWNTTFVDAGTEYDIDIFYATYDDQLWVRTIQLYMDPSLYEAVNNTIIRLNVTCTDYSNSCLEFRANFSEQTDYNYSSPYPFNDSCYHGFATGDRVRMVTVPATESRGHLTSSSLSPNITIIAAGGVEMGLAWSEAFQENGKEKDDDEYWAPWWEKTHRKHGGQRNDHDSSDDSDDSDDDRRRRLALEAESDCQGNYSEYWDVKTGSWRDTYETLDGESHILDMFFMQEVEEKNELWVTALEDWMAPSLYNQLQNTYVRLNLTCPSFSEPQSCVLFQPTFTNWSPDIDGHDAGYRFYNPAIPAVDIPDAWPNSPGDVKIITDNPIVQKTGYETETNCNGEQAQYYGEDGYWHSEFIGSDGRSRELDHVFYTTRVHELWSATIQEVWAPNIEQLLMNRTLRLRVWCTNDETAEWLFLRVGSDSLDCSDVSGLCESSTGNGDGMARAKPALGIFTGVPIAVAVLLWSFVL